VTRSSHFLPRTAVLRPHQTRVEYARLPIIVLLVSACLIACGERKAAPASDAGVGGAFDSECPRDPAACVSEPSRGGGAGGLPHAGGAPGNAAGGALNPTDSDPGTVTAEPIDDASPLFDPNTLRTYNIVIDTNELAKLDADPAAEQWAPAKLEVDGETLDVGMRYKGSAGAFLYPCTMATSPGLPPGPKLGKCSIKIGFDTYVPAGRFRGLKKLNFHSMNNDPSLLRDRLGYALFRQFGIAAPRAQHARLLVNGQLQGLFVIVEQIDGRFTRSRFSEGGEGNLYKEVWPMHDAEDVYLAALESNRDERPSAAKMLALKAAAREGAEAVEALTDMDYQLRYVAADRVMINDDGAFHFWCYPLGQGNNPGPAGNHNYYWYEAKAASRLWIVPWDMDSSFYATSFVHVDPEWRVNAPCTCGGSPGQMPAFCDPLVAVWASARSDYEAKVDDFIAGPFAPANVEQILAGTVELIADAVAESVAVGGAPGPARWQTAVANLRTIIDEARANRGYRY
jgi:spore coat protein CotH